MTSLAANIGSTDLADIQYPECFADYTLFGRKLRVHLDSHVALRAS